MRIIIIFLLFSKVVVGAVPEWFGSLDNFCPQNEICTIGEGKSLEKAFSHGREELAKILKVKVVGFSNLTTKAKQFRNDGIVEGFSYENFSNSVEELAEEILEGSYPKNIFRDGERFYVLMGLDKNKTSKIIEHKISQLDEQITHLYKIGRRAPLFKAIRKYAQRQELNSRYEFLVGRKVPERLSLVKLLDKKKIYLQKKTRVFLIFSNFDEVVNLKDFITSQFNKLGFTESNSLKDKGVFTIKLYYDFKKIFINVKGFERYSFSFSANSFNEKKIKIGTISYSTVATGRNFNQANEMANARFIKFLSEKLDQLNID